MATIDKNELNKQERYSDVEHDRKEHLSDTASSDAQILSEFTKKEESKIMHRIDRRLVLTVGLMYCISLMDRTNLSAANIAGMSRDLGLQIGTRYSTATLVFFPTYIVFQFPSTIIIRWLGPRIHLSSITFSWGLIMIGMGFMKNWQQLAALRVVLGILEAGFFPGSVYLLSTWYCRYEVQKRYSVFYIIGSLASACAGILAYGLMQMDGLQGLRGWQWIFIIEGVITCVIGIIGYVLVVDFPDGNRTNWKFLTARETKFVLARVNADRQDAHQEAWAWGKFLKSGANPRIWGYGLIFCLTTTVSYALAFFLPLILNRGMGFSVGAAQCLVAPPYAAAALLMFGTAWIGDKYHVRGPLIMFNSILCIIGLAVIGWQSNLPARYFGVFLCTMGANANVPTVLTYQANNIRGHWKRAFCSATLVGLGGVGGIIGSLVFRSQDAPAYIPGLWACITSQLLILVIVMALTAWSLIQNKKADRGERLIEELEGFRYTI